MASKRQRSNLFDARSHVLGLADADAKDALRIFGSAANVGYSPGAHLRVLLFGDYDDDAPFRAATSWDEVLQIGLRRRCEQVLSTIGVADARRTAAGYLKGSGVTGFDYEQMWRQIQLDLYPPAIGAPPRGTKRLLIIGPGFGVQATAAQFDILRSNYRVEVAHGPIDIDRLRSQIQAATPRYDAVLSGSRGGEYMVKLWKLMEQGSLRKTACLMINAHADAFRSGLPQEVPIIIAHGDNDSFQGVRGYDQMGSVPGHVHGSLERLIRTGSPGLCYLYYTRTQNTVSVGKRWGDGHSLSDHIPNNPNGVHVNGSLVQAKIPDPFSLVVNDCLPRLVDSLVFSSAEIFGAGELAPQSSPTPAFTFPVYNAMLLSSARLEAEKTLMHWPREWARKHWETDGKQAQSLFKVDPSRDQKSKEEFKAVCDIFFAEPQHGKRFYYPDLGKYDLKREIKHADIEVFRVENHSQERAMDFESSTLSAALANAGSDVVRGVHTRWLFHGASSNAAMTSIIDDIGFDASSAAPGAKLWGNGIYFSRDASFLIFRGFGKNCKDVVTGKKRLFLCLVECGLPTLGEVDMQPKPLVHPKLSLRHQTFVDSSSNPELFVTADNHQAYPAYVIHFSSSAGAQ